MKICAKFSFIYGFLHWILVFESNSGTQDYGYPTLLFSVKYLYSKRIRWTLDRIFSCLQLRSFPKSEFDVELPDYLLYHHKSGITIFIVHGTVRDRDLRWTLCICPESCNFYSTVSFYICLYYCECCEPLWPVVHHPVNHVSSKWSQLFSPVTLSKF